MKETLKLRESVFTVDNVLRILLNNKSLILLVFVMIIGQIVSDGIFFRATNLTVVVRQASINAILVMGYVMVLSSGMIDLSVGSMISLCGVMYSTAFMTLGLPLPLAIAVTIATGLVCGLVNGLMVNKLSLIPFILTMGMGQVFR